MRLLRHTAFLDTLATCVDMRAACVDDSLTTDAVAYNARRLRLD